MTAGSLVALPDGRVAIVATINAWGFVRLKGLGAAVHVDRLRELVRARPATPRWATCTP